MNTMLNNIAWFFVLFSVLGAIEGAKKQPNKWLYNALYAITNAFSIFRFVVLEDWAYVFLNSIFLIISIKGVYVNAKTRNGQAERA